MLVRYLAKSKHENRMFT